MVGGFAYLLGEWRVAGRSPYRTYGTVLSTAPSREMGSVSVARFWGGAGSVASLARPKSVTLTRPWADIITLAGLMSRWVIPFSRAAESASATARGRTLMATSHFSLVSRAR